MGLSSDLISQFVKVTKDDTKTKKETTTYGTIVEVDGEKYVQLDGSTINTPLAPGTSSVDISADDRVAVVIKNHTATITGNISNPSNTYYINSDKDTGKVGEKISEFDIVIAETAQVNKVVTEKLQFDNAEGDFARIRDIETNYLTVNERLNANDIQVNNLISADATITNRLAATEANFITIDSEFADFRNLTTDNFTATNGRVNTLETTYTNVNGRLTAAEGIVNELDVNYANIDFSNIGKVAMEHLYSESGLIKDVSIGDATITGELVGVTISGDLIKGSTIKADSLVIKGTDGLYYKLNIDAGATTTEEVTDEDLKYGLHGSAIIAKTITAEQIKVSDLVAFDATIGGFNITNDSIYSEVKDSNGNTTRGIYLNKDGQFSIGDSTNYLKYYKQSNGTFKLLISADDITFGTTKKSIQTAIDDSYRKGQSKGAQLIVNGNGILGNNTNFTSLTFDGSVSNNSPGSFTRVGIPSAVEVHSTGEYIPLDASREYTFSFDAISKNGLPIMFSYINMFDADKNVISCRQHRHYKDTTTVLTRDLNPGDTLVYVEDVSKWHYGSQPYIGFWNYKNSFGYTYPAGTYTRNIKTISNTSSSINSGAFDTENNTILLNAAYSGETIPAGTQVSQMRDGDTYKYVAAYNAKIPSEWTTYTGTMSGVDTSGDNKSRTFAPGTAYVRVAFLWNYNKADDQIWITNVSLTDTTAASQASKTATNYLNFSNSGLVVGDHTASTLGKNVLIDSDSVDIRNGTTTLASFGADTIELGKHSKESVIDLCNDTGKIRAATYDPVTNSSYSSYGLFIDSDDRVVIDSPIVRLNSDNKDTSASGYNQAYLSNYITDSSAYSTLESATKNTTTGTNVYGRLSVVSNDINNVMGMDASANQPYAMMEARNTSYLNRLYLYPTFAKLTQKLITTGNISTNKQILIGADAYGNGGRALGVNNVLWSGTWFMNSDHTAVLTEAISTQPNGIVLVFSEYIDGASSNTAFHSFFIPKGVVAKHAGVGHCVQMSSSNLAYYATKYLYINDTQITGHANNILTGASTCGITRTCNRFIMRYVIGV